MLKTSYFARSGKSPGAVSIALRSKWFTVPKYPDLAPTQEMLEIEDWHEYSHRYNDEILSRLDPQKVLNDLKVATTEHDIILLCWEKDRSTCHRGLVAQWFKKTLDLDVPEVEIPEKPVKSRTSVKEHSKTPTLSEPEILNLINQSGGCHGIIGQDNYRPKFSNSAGPHHNGAGQDAAPGHGRVARQGD